MRILFDNKLKSSGVTALNEDSNYPVTNLRSTFLEKRFQSTQQSDTLTILPVSTIELDTVAVEYTNRLAEVRVYEPGKTTFSHLTTINDDVCSAKISPAIQCEKIEVDLIDEIVENKYFYNGSTDWTLGAGALVRQQGWVAKFIDSDSIFTTGKPVTVGDTATLTASVNIGSFIGTAIQIQVRCALSTGGSVGIITLSWNSSDIGWVIKSNTATIPSNATTSNVQILTSGYVSGSFNIGFAYATVNGIPLVDNWDFADGSAEWSSVSTQQFVYDPANAYMGNAMPGGSGNTMVLEQQTSAQYPYQSIPVVAGQQYIGKVNSKAIVSGDGSGLDWSMSWRDSIGNEISSSVFGDYNADVVWTEKSATVTAPAGAVSARVQCTIGTGDGLWLVGAVSVQKVVTDKAYLGSIGFGKAFTIDPPESFWDETFDDRSTVAESDFGQVVQDYARPLRIYNFKVPTLDRTEARALQDQYLAVGRGAILWICPDTDSLPIMYGRLTEAVAVSKNKRQYAAKLTFKEAR